jgi:hypothetical protein
MQLIVKIQAIFAMLFSPQFAVAPLALHWSTRTSDRQRAYASAKWRTKLTENFHL